MKDPAIRVQPPEDTVLLRGTTTEWWSVDGEGNPTAIYDETATDFGTFECSECGEDLGEKWPVRSHDCAGEASYDGYRVAA